MTPFMDTFGRTTFLSAPGVFGMGTSGHSAGTLGGVSCSGELFVVQVNPAGNSSLFRSKLRIVVVGTGRWGSRTDVLWVGRMAVAGRSAVALLQAGTC